MPAPHVPRAPDAGPPPRPPTKPREGMAGHAQKPNGGFEFRIKERAKNLVKRIRRPRSKKDTVEVGAGNKENHTTEEPLTPEQRQKLDADNPESQHSLEGRTRDKKSFTDKVKNGLVVGIGMLPLALVIAAAIQGGIDCDNVSKTSPKITKIESAAWPEYPDWWTIWKPQMDKNKVWLTYDPAVHLLDNDIITVNTSNSAGNFDTSISGQHGVENNDDDAVVLIDIGQPYNNDIDLSNVYADFDIKTNCIDRMAYAAGKDVATILKTGGSMFGGLFDSIPWTTIFYIIIFILAIWFVIKAISIARS